jgi:hypothetical protein
MTTRNGYKDNIRVDVKEGFESDDWIQLTQHTNCCAIVETVMDIWVLWQRAIT